MAMSFQVSSRTVWRVGLNVMGLLLLWRAFGRLGLVLTLVVLALFVALALDAPVRWLQGRGLARGWAVLVVMVALCGVIALMVRTLIPMLVDQAHLLARTAPGLAERLSQWEWLREADARYGLKATLVRTLQGLPGMLAGSVVGVLSTTLLGVAAGLTVLVLVLFMLLFGGALVQDGVGLLEAGRRARALALLGRMREAVGGYLAGAITQALVGGAVTAGFTFLLGIPYYVALGLAYLVLGFIPYAGSAIVAVLVSFTALGTAGLHRALLALGIFLVYQQVESHLLQPFIQRRAIRMNPLLITLVVLVGTGAWGLMGALVALPVAAALQVALREVREWRPPPPGRGEGSPAHAARPARPPDATHP